jgi:hypothetical protein
MAGSVKSTLVPNAAIWTPHSDPDPPVGFLESCPMQGPDLSRFAATTQPFVTSGSRPSLCENARGSPKLKQLRLEGAHEAIH